MPVEKTSPAFQFYPKDFLSSSKVQGMSMTERGIYMTLLCHCWLDGSLPDNLDALARLVGMKAGQFERLWVNSPLHQCFVQSDGELLNARLDIERRKQADYRRRQSDHGKRGGRKKGLAIPGLPVDEGLPPKTGKGEQSSSSSISDLPGCKEHNQVGEAPPRPMAAIHDRSHIRHVVCGRVCLHSSQFDEFVRRRNGDREGVRTWASGVIDAWNPGGAHAEDEPGDSFDFWRHRYAEQWPAAGAAAKGARVMSYQPWECPHVDPCSHRAMCEIKSAQPAKYPVKSREAVS